MGLPFNLGRDSAAITSDASLNVGIGGAPSGSYKFEVTGTAKVSSGLFVNTTDNSSGAKLQVYGSINFKGNSGYNGWIISQTGGNSSAAFNLSYGSGGASNVITAEYNTGYVGIGTASPVSTLDVSSTTPTITIRNSSQKNWNSGDQIGYLDQYIDDTSSAGARIVSYVRSVVSAGVSSGITVASDLTFGTANYDATATEKMRITNGGNVGIGITSTDGKLHVNAGTGQNFVVAGDGTNICSINNYSSANGFQELKIVGSPLSFYTGNAGEGSVTKRMYITGTGLLYYGNTSVATNPIITFQNSSNGYQFGFTSTGTQRFTFINGAPSEVGYLTGAGVFYSSGGGTSDARMKQNIEYINSGLDNLLILKPAMFEFTANPEKKRRGFIAQDVLKVIPDLVLGNGDEEDGIYGLDYDGILALTVKAIQEQNQLIQELRTDIELLKNK